MGFWDTVGDVAEMVPVAGPAFNSTLDWARAIDDGKIGDDETKASISNILGENYSFVGDTLQGAETGYRYWGRGLSTVGQMEFAPGDPTGVGPFWQREAWSRSWRNSAKISAGQAATFRLSRTLGVDAGLDEDADWENLWQYGKVHGQEGDRFNPRFSFVSGASDALLMWFADPLVIGGKAVKTANTVRKTLKPGDLGAIQSGADLTRRQRRLATGVDSVIEITRGKTAAELLQHQALRESSQGDTLAYLIARANKEQDIALRDSKVKDILAIGFGDPVAKQRLLEKDEALSLDLDNLLRDLDDAVLGSAGRASADDVKAIKDELRVRQSYRFELDRMRSVEGALGNEVPDLARGGDFRRLNRLRSDVLLQDGIASTPVRVMRWAGGYRPQGWVKLEDSRQTLQNVERMLDRVPGLPAERRVAWLDEVINAQTPATRSESILRLEQRVFGHLAGQHGLDKKAAERLVSRYQSERDAILQSWGKRRYTGATRPANADEASAMGDNVEDVFVDSHLDESGQFIAAPILDSQLRNEMPLMDVDHINKILKRGGDRGRALTLVDEAGSLTSEALDLYSQVWKLSALMRLGYMLRTVADPQIRMLATLGGMAYTATAATGTKNAIINRLGKITVEDADDLARRTQAQIRLDEIAEELRRAESMPKFYRVDGPEAVQTATKPQGLYMSIDRPGFQSPFKDGMNDIEGGIREHRWQSRVALDDDSVLRPEPFSLTLDGLRSPLPYRGFEAEVDAGVAALRQLIGRQKFDEAVAEARKGKAHFAEYMKEKYRLVRWYKYTDTYEMLMAYGALVARDAGYKGIFRTDALDSNMDEFVALTDDILTTGDDAAALAEKSELQALLASPVKTVTRKRAKDERARMGVGDTEIAGYTVPGAHGDDFKASLHHIDARESLQNLLAGSETQIRKRLRERMSGSDFELVKGTDIGYEDAWTRVVNRQIRNSAPAKLVLEGKSDAEVLSALRSTVEGRRILHDMRIIHGDLDEWVAGVRATVDHALAGRDELYEIARTRELTADDLAAVLPNELSRPAINGGAIAENLGDGTWSRAWGATVEKFYTFMNDMPETVMGRHPMYVNLYKRRMEGLLKNADEAIEGGLTRTQIEAYAASARQWARDEMKRTLFDISGRRNPGHLLRWVFPFFNAWEDVMMKYGRIVMQDPSRLARAAQIWKAPESYGITVDSEGNLVVPGKGVEDDHYVMLSKIGGGAVGRSLKGLTGINDWRISKNSANIILQGDPVFLPGFGPMVQVPASEIVKRKPDLAGELSWALPFGPAESAGEVLMPIPRWVKLAHKALNPDDEDFKQTWTYLHQTEVMRYNTGERDTMPTSGEIDKKARNWYIARAFAAGVLPVSVQPQGEMQWYFDEAHRMRAEAATDRELYPNGWEQAFYEKYPEYFEATVSLSKNNTGIDATEEGFRATKKWKDLIAEKPEFGWFVVGPEDEGAFSGAVYTSQRTQRIGSGSSARFRETKDPRESIATANARRGWIEYRKISAQIEAIRISRGLSSLQAAGAEDLADFKAQFRAYLGQQNPDWQRDYEQIDQGKVRDFLSFAAKVVTDKRASGRADLAGMAEYLTYREQVRAILAARGGTLQSNPDVALVWAGITASLTDRYIQFADTYSRMLENDDLTQGVE